LALRSLVEKIQIVGNRNALIFKQPKTRNKKSEAITNALN